MKTPATDQPTAEARRLSPDDYRVRLDQFEGPLDLLLYLIRRDELDIYNIPIAPITNQYLAFLDQLTSQGSAIDIETAGDFLVMASTLMEIKSRTIGQPDQPAAEADAAEHADDPRSDLVRQLLEYKKFRDLADALDERREQWERRYPAARVQAESDAVRRALDDLGDVDLEDLALGDLVDAFSRILATVNFDRLGEHEVVADDTPLELHAEDILDQLRSLGPTLPAEPSGIDHPTPTLPLRTILTGRTRAEMVGLFLALLDLIRTQRVSFRQQQTADDTEGPANEIVIALRDPPPDAPPDGSPDALPDSDHPAPTLGSDDH